MKIYYAILISVAVFFSACTKSTINEGEKPGEGPANQVLVTIDQKKCVTPWGETLLSGETRRAYKASNTQDCKVTCESISADVTCTDGVLSNADAHPYISCEKPFCDCDLSFLPKPVTLKHGDFISLFTKSVSECESCGKFEVRRQCVDGVLTGDAAAVQQSCDTKACQNCQISETETLLHGASRDFFKSATGLSCDPALRCDSASVKASRMCMNGVLNGDSTFSKLTCANNFCGCKIATASYAHAAPVVFYKNAEAKCSDSFSCESPANKVTTSCQDGVIAGLVAGASPTCKQELCSCTYKDAAGNVTILSDGQTIPVYNKTTVACGVSCDAAKGSITCSKGVLTGNTNYISKGCVPESCGCPFGNRILNDGQTVDVYSNAAPACGSLCTSFKGSVTCTKAVLSGDTTFTATECKEKSCNCTYTNLDNKLVTIANTMPGVVYSAKMAMCGSTCADLKGSVQCNNAVLTGNTTYMSDSCTQQNCECVTPWNQKILAAETKTTSNKITFYKQNTSVCGQAKCALLPNNTVDYYCMKEGSTTKWVDAGNNVITTFPEYKFPSCTDPNCACTVSGNQIAQGSASSFYKVSTVACGDVCDKPDQSITVKCNDDLSTSVTPLGANLQLFFQTTVYKSCQVAACPQGEPTAPPSVSDGSGDGDKGDGGGTGGGTGDGEGPGIGFGGRSGGGPGSGGPVNKMIFKGYTQKIHPYACTLPWGGTVTQGSSVMMFKVASAPPGKKCSEFRVYRMCIAGQFTGDSTAVQLNCQESL